eukprot:scaffold1102_cov195-Alexandrium_tamarense.AAC.3
MATIRFGLLALFEVLLALRMDGTIVASWSIIFIPIYLWEGECGRIGCIHVPTMASPLISC